MHHSIFNHKVRGDGRTAHYICASKPTLDVLERMQRFENVTYTPRMAREKVKILRDSWELFMADPSEYVTSLLEVSPGYGHEYVMCTLMIYTGMFL